MQTSLLKSPTASLPAPPKTARVLHVINGEDYAGAERVQDTLGLLLPDFGYDVGFACLKPGRFAHARQARRAPVYQVPMRNKFDRSPVRRLTQLVQDEGYEIVHTHTPRTALIGAAVARRTGRPLVHHIHCQTAVEVGRRRLQDCLNLLLERWATHRAANVIAVSPSLYRYLLRRGYSSRQVRLVANGVPLRKEALACGARDGPFTLGIVALFRPRKGLEVLLRALALLRDQGVSVRLRAVGRFQSAEYERQVKQIAAAQRLDDLIEWRGFREDVMSELANIDALVLPSLVSEAMPMCVLEAMAAGVLVIGSRVDGITDLIIDGQDGLLVRPGDAADLAAAAGKIVSGEADSARLRRNALSKQRRHYSDRSLATGVAEVYREVLGR